VLLRRYRNFIFVRESGDHIRPARLNAETPAMPKGIYDLVNNATSRPQITPQDRLNKFARPSTRVRNEKIQIARKATCQTCAFVEACCKIFMFAMFVDDNALD